MSRRLSITVFAGAQPAPDGYRELARDLGRSIARAGHRLVFGGGATGLMGELQRACREAGGEVRGIILERVLAAGDPSLPLEVHATMWDRKRALVEAADAFIALPGGLGTLEELVEVLSLALLGILDRPVVALDADGFFEPLALQLDRAMAAGLAPQRTRSLWARARTAAEALALVEAGADGPPPA